MTNERKEELYNNMLDHISELVNGEDLIDTLHGIGFTDEELIEEGFEFDLKQVCCHCGEAFDSDPDDTIFYNGKPLCDICYQAYYGYCEVCEELHPYEEMFFADGNYCEQCIYKLLDKEEELETRVEELEGQLAYECECNKELVDTQKENERLKEEIKKLKGDKN